MDEHHHIIIIIRTNHNLTHHHPAMASSNGDESKRKELPQEQSPFEKLNVKELKALLKGRGLPVSGRKADLVDRLRNPLTGPKPKLWQHSGAKKDLKRALLDPNSPIHNMSVEQILGMDARYKQYPKFKKYYEDLKEKVEEEKRVVEIDDLAARMHLMSFPTPHMNARGYPNWKGHPAKELLEVDVAKKLQDKMKPVELQKTRNEYKEFPLHVFRKHLYQEVDKQRGSAYWADKRNKKALKKYLERVKERAAAEA